MDFANFYDDTHDTFQRFAKTAGRGYRLAALISIVGTNQLKTHFKTHFKTFKYILKCK